MAGKASRSGLSPPGAGAVDNWARLTDRNSDRVAEAASGPFSSSVHDYVSTTGRTAESSRQLGVPETPGRRRRWSMQGQGPNVAGGVDAWRLLGQHQQQLARAIGVKSVQICDPGRAASQRLPGGNPRPSGLRKPMPVCMSSRASRATSDLHQWRRGPAGRAVAPGLVSALAARPVQCAPRAHGPLRALRLRRRSPPGGAGDPGMVGVTLYPSTSGQTGRTWPRHPRGTSLPWISLSPAWPGGPSFEVSHVVPLVDPSPCWQPTCWARCHLPSSSPG